MRTKPAEILREYGPFPAGNVGGVTYDGERVWYAGGDALVAFDPESGKTVRSIDVAAHAGTAFDGRHLYQIAEDRISKIDPATGRVLSSIPAPGGGGDSGLAWAEGTLWVGEYRCLLYTSDAADERSSVDLGGRRIIKKKKKKREEK